MTNTVEYVDSWRRADTEHERLGFKEGKNQFANDKLNAYGVAMANEGGGPLLIGIADKRPLPVVGTAAFNDRGGITGTLFDKLGFRVDVEAVEHPDGRVVVFTIPSRSRGTAFHLDGKYLMRSNESLVPMTEDRLRGIFTEGQRGLAFGDGGGRFATRASRRLARHPGSFRNASFRQAATRSRYPTSRRPAVRQRLGPL